MIKGKPQQETFTIYTGMGNGDCGFGFSEGGRYIIYANLSADKEYWTSICSRTQTFRKNELQQLEEWKNSQSDCG